ncbi:hypothetical protein HME9304_01218 [Flagellimonas maritima]|uniref:Uncharacterized protein n=1 Tax=Flagellimonas maritima TaxID=1383885 RepID=A0A2Z4LSA1_9FLAO|nr:hypothetical protein [Allomuricauda aurantiaca]AWX44218.1 hypothetical protein HME9304_01218 [Allomuricauda aurantiaca]
MKSLEIIFSLIAAILTAFVSYKWKNIDILGKITLIAVIIATIFIAINSFRQTKKEALIERVNAKFGDIKTSSSPRMQIKLGDKEWAAGFVTVSGVFRIGNYGPWFKLGYENNTLLINFIIRDLNGKVIAVIEDNVWTIFDNNYEYNNDDTTFEMVTKGERKVFFQIKYRKGEAYLTGFLLDEKANGFAIYGMEKGKGTKVKPIGENKQNAPTPTDLNIPRIFKYPRGKYLGVKL